MKIISDLRNINNLDKLTDDILNKYEKEYAGLGVDGIYFQSFTEMGEDSVPGVVIAEVVTDFVNKTAGKFLEKYPNMLIQFGLHATSVKSSFKYINKLPNNAVIL